MLLKEKNTQLDWTAALALLSAQRLATWSLAPVFSYIEDHFGGGYEECAMNTFLVLSLYMKKVVIK